MNRKISTPIAIIIIVVCAVLVGGLATWQVFYVQQLNIPKEILESKVDIKERIAHNLWVTYLDGYYNECKSPYALFRLNCLKNYSINDIKIDHIGRDTLGNNCFTFRVDYSVQTAEIQDPKFSPRWLIGGGKLAENNWINNKLEFVDVAKKSDGQYKIINVGPDRIAYCYTSEDKFPRLEDFPKINFEDYPILEQFKGTPAPVDFSTDPDALRFVTRITQGAKEGPNFAGHYTIIWWGCGTECQGGVIVDARTGAISGHFGSNFGIEYRIDSNLLIVNPPDAMVKNDLQLPKWFYTVYYKMENNKLVEIYSSRKPEDSSK